MDTVSSGYYVRKPRIKVDRAVQTDKVFIKMPMPTIFPAPIRLAPITLAVFTTEQLHEANDREIGRL